MKTKLFEYICQAEMNSFIHSFIHSFTRLSLSTFCGPGSVLGAEDTKSNNMQSLLSWSFCSSDTYPLFQNVLLIQLILIGFLKNKFSPNFFWYMFSLYLLQISLLLFWNKKIKSRAKQNNKQHQAVLLHWESQLRKEEPPQLRKEEKKFFFCVRNYTFSLRMVLQVRSSLIHQCHLQNLLQC